MTQQEDRKFNRIQKGKSCVGYAEFKDNCWNFSIISTHEHSDVLTNEYVAGFIQGELQGEDMIRASRNNTWKNSYLCDTSHTFPHTCPPEPKDLKKAENSLKSNYLFTTKWIRDNREEPAIGKYVKAIERLFYRMWGIYDALSCGYIRSIDEVKNDLFNWDTFSLGYGEDKISFGDIYFINTQMDLMDAVANSLESTYGLHKPDHCSAFVKRTDDGDIVWTHNSWCGYLSNSHTISYTIRNNKGGIDFVSQNSYCFGQVGSNMDFGFNKHGICFNETTHRYSYNPMSQSQKEEAVWLCWRSAAAEMFATDIDDFFNYIKTSNSGTYLNGYMVIDANTKEMSLIEMSYKRFAMLRCGKDSCLTGKYEPENEFDPDLDYDKHLVTNEYILGVNYPVFKKVAYDLGSTDNRPLRRVQFFDMIGNVNNEEDAKALITHIADDEPLSIYGRWDLGFGTTEYPRTIPDGAVDSKAFSANKVLELLSGLKYEPSDEGTKTSFWMLYGVAWFKGKPFVWSQSPWKEYKDDPAKDFVPDELTGKWHQTKLFLK